MMADYRVEDSVAVKELNNPPVNALSRNVRFHIDRYVKQALAEYSPWFSNTGEIFDAGNKPVVAAIQGMALGGGLDVALFCHYRNALKAVRFGFPEVLIGLMPGGAGTQRLPRVAGLLNALEMITTGNLVSAEKALGMGIIDKIISGNMVEEGIKFARSVASRDFCQVCLRYKDVRFQGDIDRISEAALAKVRADFNGSMAPVFCVNSVLNSVRLPYEAGVNKENDYFWDLVYSGQAAAQKYSFFAERAVCRWQLPSGENYKTAKPVSVKTAGVIGAGTMGRGIVLSLIPSGFPCVLVEQSKEIAAATKRPEKVVGTHFFYPAYNMKLIENIYGTHTSAETVATVMKLGKAIKKVPVLVGSCTGFVANRMYSNYLSEAQFMVEEGALPHDIDQVLKDFGMPMGIFEASNLSGLDVEYRMKRETARASSVTLTGDSRLFQSPRNCRLIKKLIEKGRLGKKVGRGWYKYERPGDGTPSVDPEVTALIEDHCQNLRLERRSIGSQEILERMHYAMINEGFKILEDGKCSMPEEIDVIWLYGFSWPNYAGGPMFYSSKVGLKKVYERICYYHTQHPYSMYWVPSPLLKKLSETDLPIERWGEVARGSKL